MNIQKSAALYSQLGYRQLALLLLSLTLILSGSALAAGSNGSDKQRTLRGLYVGTLDLGNQAFKPISLTLEKDGQMTVIAQQDDGEQESTGLGQWRKSHGKTAKIGVIFYRTGHVLCSDSDPNQEETCTLVLTGDLKVSKSGLMTGDVTAKIRDRSSGGDGFDLILPLEAQKTSVTDLTDL